MHDDQRGAQYVYNSDNALFSANDNPSKSGDASQLDEKTSCSTLLEGNISQANLDNAPPISARRSSRPLRARVDPAAIAHNLAQLRRHLAAQGAEPMPRIWATTKANAYGHGLHRVLPALHEADGLAVLLLSEAATCYQAGWHRPILVYAGLLNSREVAYLDIPELHLVITNPAQLDWLAESQPACPPDLWLRYGDDLDLSMGFNAANYAAAYACAQTLVQQGRVRGVGHLYHGMSRHTANPNPETEQAFLQLVHTLPGPISADHAAAYPCHNAAVPRPAWLRYGLCLYGVNAEADDTVSSLALKPAMSLHSKLISIWDVAAGDSVCYGRAFVAPEAMRIGIVACGYGDGYPRHAVTGTPVLVDGVRTRLLGRGSMDAMVVDLTPTPEVRIGAPVTLWGASVLPAEEVARSAGSIAAQLLTGLTARVPIETVDEAADLSQL